MHTTDDTYKKKTGNVLNGLDECECHQCFIDDVIGHKQWHTHLHSLLSRQVGVWIWIQKSNSFGIFPEIQQIHWQILVEFNFALWLGQIQGVQWPLCWELLIKSYDTGLYVISNYQMSEFTTLLNVGYFW